MRNTTWVWFIGIITGLALCLSTTVSAEESLVTKKVSSGPVAKTTPESSDPISMSNGAFFQDWNLFSLGGPMPVDFILHYRPALWNSSPSFLVPRLDEGNYGVFTCNQNIELIKMINTNQFLGETQMVIFLGDHEEIMTYNDVNDEYESSSDIPYKLKLINGYYILADIQQQLIYIFESVNYGFSGIDDWESVWWGRVQTKIDRNGNSLSYTYTAANESRLSQVSDGLGRILNLNYQGVWAPLKNVTDGNGRVVAFSYAGATFTSMTNQLGYTTQFEVGTNNQTRLITRIIRPEGNSHINQTWTSTPKGEWFFGIETQYDAYSNRSDITYSTYSNGSMRVVFTYPDGHTGEVQNVDERYPAQLTDSDGNQANMSYNTNHQLTAVTDRYGDTSTMLYHDNAGYLTAFTNALGNGISHVYNAISQTFTNPADSNTFSFIFYDLARTDYSDGTYEIFKYDAHGNITNHLDRAGNGWNYTYNSQGLPLTITNPSGGITLNTYNPDGTIASSTDSDIGTTVYGYDSFKRLVRINPTGAGQTDLVYDLMDKIISVTNKNGNSTQYQYDSNGNLITIIDSEGYATHYEYDLMDRLAKITTRTGVINTFAYTYDNKTSAFTNGNGIVASHTYDKFRRLRTTVINGKTNSYTYGIEGIMTSSTDPDGHTVWHQSDKLGNLEYLIQPGGQTNYIARDSMTRVISITDPLTQKTQYDYDNLDNLIKVILPDSTSAIYTRNAIGKITNICDLNKKNWAFNYTPMGRLTATIDPLSRTNTYINDSRGRIESVVYADGSIASNTYDNADNLLRRQYSDGTDLVYVYDSLDNITNTTNLVLTRDHDERITSSTYNGHTFGAIYDAGERIATVTYDGVFTVTYTYNDDGRLNRVLDTFGNQVDFSYTAAGNITNVIRANGLNASYTWDANGHRSHISDGGIIDIAYVYDDADQITSATGTFPLSPRDLTSYTHDYGVDAASQISEPGYMYDDRGRATQIPGYNLFWDDAERLTAISNLSYMASISYNGLNEIISRTAGGITTHYYHQHSLRFNPIVAEQQNSSFTRYYVYTPSGHLLYNIDPQNGNAVSYYHHDQVGSVLALSDSTGAVTDRYAYSPYGVLLDHEGTSDQPYTFVGTWGVRKEGDLYQMRRRYYDPVTARFLSKEPIWPQITNPGLINPYQYALSSPLVNVDVTGLFFLSKNFFAGTLEDYRNEFYKYRMNEYKESLEEKIGDEADQYMSLLRLAWQQKHDLSHLEEIFNVLLIKAKARAIEGKAQAQAAHFKALGETGINGNRDVKAVSMGMSMKSELCKMPPPDPVTYKDQPASFNYKMSGDQFTFVMSLVESINVAQVQQWMLGGLFGGGE